MIASIEGIVEAKTLDRVVICASGIGYEIYVTDITLSGLEKDKPAKLFIREQIKEDAHDLYGFLSMEAKQLFEKLLSVKNVGPKVALSVLNIGSSEKVRMAIASGDVLVLQSAKGVGRRAAEQIVVELRDKVGLAPTSGAEAVVGRSGDQEGDEAVEALVSLGYSIYDARTSLAGIDSTLPVEDRIKQALKVAK
ncbi:MAG: Holliday junction branch migration protein RuvA [Candidatus Saccharimonadales bacterium]